MVWLAQVIMYVVVGFIGYMIAFAVDKKQIGQMIVLVTILITLITTIQSIMPFIEKVNRFISPDFNYPVQGEITQYFQPGEHHGIDIAAPEGTPIKAERKGYVLEARNMDIYGLTVIIDYGGNISWLYGHCSKVYVRKGQTVLQGTKIALTGNSGRSTGPHLHLEIRKNGVSVDPLAYLK